MPERVEIVRFMGPPLRILPNGTADEHFDTVGTLTDSLSRDIARSWGAYQAGVVARFLSARGGGLQATDAQVLEARGASRLGLMRQVAGLVEGNDYYFSVSYFLSPPEETGPNSGKVRLGVDASGGADPSSLNVAWAEGRIVGEWASLMLPEVRAGAERVTVFLELEDGEERRGAIAKLDGLEIQAQETWQRPDLLIEDIWVEQDGRASCAILDASLRIQVRNRGASRAPSFNTVVSGVGGVCGPWRVRGLEPGEVFVFTCDIASPGDYMVRVVVDASNEVGEADENNNWAQKEVTVLPACPPTPTPTPTSLLLPTQTPSAIPTPSPTAPTRAEGAPLCLGSPVSFGYLGTDWTLSLDGWRQEVDDADERWVRIVTWGTITRARRHEVERVVAGVGDADLGKMLSLTVIDDHGYAHVANQATIGGPLAVETRLQFEDIRGLRGTFAFQVEQFPAPSVVSSAMLQVRSLPGYQAEGSPLQFMYSLADSCCWSVEDRSLGEPHLPPGVIAGDHIRIAPYLTLELTSVRVSEDGTLLTAELALENTDYVTLRPRLGPALVINSDWSFGAYLGDREGQLVNWRDAELVWQTVTDEGVPPLSDLAPEPYGLRVYALAPNGMGPWEKPILYLPRWDAAMNLY